MSDRFSTDESTNWDVFLDRSPRGQFQQTSRWARVKALDGWNAHRIFADEKNPGKGGLQLLWKNIRFGRIGYVSKGPVLEDEDAPIVNATLDKLKISAVRLGLKALILQPPDDSGISESMLFAHDFERRAVPTVIRATASIDLSCGQSICESRMSSRARQEIRSARKRGLAVRMGGRSDLPTFFALMRENCRRLGTVPNPARLELVEALWDAFTPHIFVGFAESAQTAVAGLLMIGQGRRLTFWKKGWKPNNDHAYANGLLTAEALNWGRDLGYNTVDFASIDATIAKTLLAGETLTDEQQRSRYKFILRLGAQPKMLPPAQLLILNPVLRRLYRAASRIPAFDKWMMRRLGSA